MPKASAVRALVGTLLVLPAIGILAALAAGVVSGSTALLMLFLVAGGQFEDGRWSWFIGFAAFHGLYGLLIVAQEVALARRWIAGRSAPFEMVGRIFSAFQVG